MAKSDLKLVFYSGGQNPENHQLHKALIGLVGKKKRISMTYIPFCSEGAAPFFGRFKRRYRRFGATDFHCLPVDQPFTASEKKKALSSDIIYLAGGNTFYFLNSLRKSKMLTELRNFAKRGGILAGLSAGGIILTPNIELAGFPPFDPDENDVGITQLKALNLVDFEFFPHYANSKRVNDALSMYSLIAKNPIFASHDGGGIVINGNKKTFYGKSYLFYQGKKISVL